MGAPYVDDVKLAEELNRSGLAGVRFVPIQFTPDASVFKGQLCRGVNLLLTDRNGCDPVDVGLQLARTMYRLYPTQFDPAKMDHLLKHPPTLDAIRADRPLPDIHALWQKDLDAFRTLRAKYLMY